MSSISTLTSPQPLKRERHENGLKTPLCVPQCESLLEGKVDGGGSLDNPLCVPDCTLPSNGTVKLEGGSSRLNLASSKRSSSPSRSCTGSLNEVDTATPPDSLNSRATAFTNLNGIIEPPKKRVKLTFAEKEEQRVLKAVREQEKADERARKECEKKAKEEDRARRDAEREAERKKRDDEREMKKLIKDAERAEKEREKKGKEDEKRRKEDEKLRMEEEKRRKEKSQPKLNAFFKKSGMAALKGDVLENSPSPTPGPTLLSTSIPAVKSPNKNNNLSEYQRIFPPFFVQKNVKVAPLTQFGRDGSASDVLQDVIDGYIQGHRSIEKRRYFDSVKLFNLPGYGARPRGRRVIPVRDIMPQILGNATRPIDLTTESQNIQIRNTRKLLQAIPYKILSFAEDVRPPYKGTYTSQPMSGMRKLARNPTSRDLPNVNYDYDSEAEWEAEDGEDIESDCDEDEEAGDGEDLDEFLDDAEAEMLNVRKHVIQGDLEPKCSGLCWEDEKRRGPHVKMYRYLMEIINESTPIKIPIDPFATHYWETATPAGVMDPPRLPLNAIKSTSAGMNSTNKSMKMLGTSDINKPAYLGHSTTQPPKKLVSMEDMPAFKQAVNGSELSKLGLIEVLNKQFSKIPKSTIKHTLETIAKRVGSKEAEKRWVLVEEGRC